MEACVLIDSMNTKEINSLKIVVAGKDSIIALQNQNLTNSGEHIKFLDSSVKGMIEVVESQNKDIKKLQRKNYLLSVSCMAEVVVIGLLYLGYALKP